MTTAFSSPSPTALPDAVWSPAWRWGTGWRTRRRGSRVRLWPSSSSQTTTYLRRVGGGADGQIGTFTRVVHQPSGRSRMMNSLTSTDTRPLHLLDALVEELWHAGLLTGTYKHAEQGTTAGGERMSNQSD